MYVSSNNSGSFHICRQRFPDGQPEQITDGPTDEEGLEPAVGVCIADSRADKARFYYVKDNHFTREGHGAFYDCIRRPLADYLAGVR